MSHPLLETSMPVAAEPCRACPWLISNHGKRHPDGWYTKTNLRRLWAGLRRGEKMSCHPTDPSNPVTARAQEKGYKVAPDGAQTKRCVGSVVLVQREMMRLQNVCGSDFSTYRREYPGGLTRFGFAGVLDDAMFGGGPRPDLNLPVATADERLTWPL